jgi:hypothetical protein
MRRLELACETQIMAQSGGAKLIYPSMDVVRKTAGQTTMTVDQGVDVDGPGMVWAAVRRLMDQLDPSYAT